MKFIKNIFISSVCMGLLIFFHMDFCFAAPVKKRLAILEFSAFGTMALQARIIRNRLEEHIVKSGTFTVLERSRIDMILREHEMQMSGCTDSECAVEYGRLLSTDFIIIGTLYKLKKYILSVKIVEVKSGKIISSRSEKFTHLEKSESAIAQISFYLTGKVAEIYYEPIDYTVFIPGLWHYHNGHDTKGHIFMTGFILTGTATIVSVYYLVQKRKEYQEHRDYPEYVGDTSYRDSYDRKYKEYRIAANAALYSGILFLSVFIANWIDIGYFSEPAPESGTEKNAGWQPWIDCYSTRMPAPERRIDLGLKMRF